MNRGKNCVLAEELRHGQEQALEHRWPDAAAVA